MRLGIANDRDYSTPGLLEQQVATVKIADDLGFEAVTGIEAWELSTLPWLTVMARETQRMRIGTSILNVFSRSPGAIAQELAALDLVSGGRAMLGLGSSAAAVVEHFHGVPFDRPLTRIREYVEIFRTLIAGERLRYDGEIFHLEMGFRLDYSRPRDRIPVYLASITPRSVKQTAEIADGIIPLHWPRDRFAELRARLDEHSLAAGRETGAVEISPIVAAWVTDGTNDKEQWRAARAHIAGYTTRMGNFYWQMFERHGYEGEVAAARAAAAERDQEATIAAISDRMVRDLAVIGRPEEIREQLQERSEHGAEVQLLQHLPWDPKVAGPILETLLR